jgi:hypothetical protein
MAHRLLVREIKGSVIYVQPPYLGQTLLKTQIGLLILITLPILLILWSILMAK